MSGEIKHFPASHDFCRLFSHLLKDLVAYIAYIANNMNLD